MKILLATLVLAATLITDDAMAIEEPEYVVVAVFDDFELRHYKPYIVAEVDVSGDRRAADRGGFRILADYIFGNNSAATKMAMTAPVESSVNSGGTRMAMTAPVTSEPGGSDNESRYAFVMEAKYTMDTLPQPNDKRIRIREIPERIMAVRRYSGRWTQSGYKKHEETLLSALQESGIEAIAAPILARYNSPFSLPIFRRNEVMVEVVVDENEN